MGCTTFVAEPDGWGAMDERPRKIEDDGFCGGLDAANLAEGLGAGNADVAQVAEWVGRGLRGDLITFSWTALTRACTAITRTGLTMAERYGYHPYR